MHEHTSHITQTCTLAEAHVKHILYKHNAKRSRRRRRRRRRIRCSAKTTIQT